jgi:glycosyltransferase involved in cell wall biosynthesis
MMDKPLVSVVVPVYGVENFIETCARSLLAQTYPFVEFVFVDDGSPDRSVPVLRQVLEEFPDRDCRIVSKKNEGQALARKFGISLSRGMYILQVDSDDYIEPDCVEKLVAEALREGADLVVFDVVKEWGGGRRHLSADKDSSFVSPERFVKDLYSYKAHGYVVNKFCARELCENLFYPRHPMHEDIIFCTQVVSRVRKMVHLKEPLYHYVRTRGTASTRVPKKVRRSFSARNMMDTCLYFHGKEDSPFRNLEDELVLWAAWTGFTMDRSLFRDFPALRELALGFRPACGRHVSLPAQLLLRCWLKLSRP